ncbi:hypothetical protein QCA50_005745 [Cerrena zonata]|uniref:Uncharacterized protein n=1 Tax=Cerrena zonata TaxID=2478898 RepID=A0AAW0GM29_9APHY
MQAPRTYSAYPPSSADFFPSSVPTSSSPRDYFKPSPRSPPKSVTGTHPALYRALDDVIGLADCEVYSYAPDQEFDPHANDFSDDEDDVASVGDENSTDDEEETQFELDDYDVDEVPRRPSWRGSLGGRTSSSTDSDDLDMQRTSSPHIRMRRRGALLWSSHWFFLNRKLKRILFVSVWARSKGIASWMDDDSFTTSPEKITGERFFGWDGAVGAGARAMGLSSSM